MQRFAPNEVPKFVEYCRFLYTQHTGRKINVKCLAIFSVSKINFILILLTVINVSVSVIHEISNSIESLLIFFNTHKPILIIIGGVNMRLKLL